jgi:phenylalanyl-tRNA synthetase alpha chain
MEIKNKLDEIKKSFEQKIKEADTFDSLEKIRIEYFGKKSELIDLAKNIKNFSEEERPLAGKFINEVKNEIMQIFEDKKLELEQNNLDSKNFNMKNFFDKTIPGRNFSLGNLHPITKTMKEVVEIFEKLGFGIAQGPDIEADYYNFAALNFPDDHPARDMQDTFFLDAFDSDYNKQFILRTHTSPVQIRYMQEHKPPFQIISPGSVYRCDSDVSHTPMFHQVEGLAIGENITFANLKWVLTEFIHKMFGEDIKTRFRPSFFPFTEPSVEVDMSCVICGGKGCRVCKNTGWVEILGAGMVHPNVLKNVGYDTEKFQGFAFGMGIERIAIIKYQVNDIRLFFENDIRFLKQI